MSIADRLLNAGVILAVVLVGYLLIRPSQGPIAVAFNRWQDRKQVDNLIHNNWDDIASEGPTLRQASGIRLPPDRVQVVVFFDYECPFCLRLDKELATLDERGRLPNVVMRHFPLPNHPAAKDAAVAAICADQQGQFYQMHKFLASDEWRASRDFEVMAIGGGISDTAKFNKCITSDAPDSVLAADRRMGERLLISGTPAVITRLKRFDGFMSGDSLLQVITTN